MKSQFKELANKLRRLSQRAVLSLVTYSNGVRFIQIQTEGGLLHDDVEHIEPFGFTSHAFSGAEAVVLSFKGNGSHTVAIMVDDKRYKLQIEEGDVAIYNRHGDKVHIKDDGNIEIKASIKVLIDTPEAEFTGIVKGVDFITSRGVKLDSHDHDESIGSKTARPNA